MRTEKLERTMFCHSEPRLLCRATELLGLRDLQWWNCAFFTQIEEDFRLEEYTANIDNSILKERGTLELRI